MTYLTLLPSRLRRVLRAGLLLTAFFLAGLASGCLEKIDPDIALDPKLAGQYEKWELAGRFGGEAKLVAENPDPMQERFEPGGFRRIAGVNATGGEVWVCDLGISRLQVFDDDGNFKRSYGRGVPLATTLPDDTRLWHDMGKRQGDPSSWNTANGAAWFGHEGELFQFADVQVWHDYLWAADWAKTGVKDSKARLAGVLRFALPDPWLGSQDSLGQTLFKDNDSLAWPAYLAAGENCIATCEPWANTTRLYNPAKLDAPKTTDIGVKMNVGQLLDARVGGQAQPQYLEYLQMRNNASGAPAKFNQVGGMAVAFDKIVIADTNNERLQVFDGHTDDQYYWGKLLRIIPAIDPGGFTRFSMPLDVDVAPNGHVYVLDLDRLEVAVLNSKFERIGAFGHGMLVEPWALDLSDDGRDCFVSDCRSNQVLHFRLQGEPAA